MPPPRMHATPLLTRLRNLRPSFRASPFFHKPNVAHIHSGGGKAALWGLRGFIIAMGVHWFLEYFYAISACSGPSMLPTIPHSGAFILFSKLHKRGRNIKVGDMVMYDHPVMPNSSGLKRVIGMPGDLVCVMTPGKTGNADLDKDFTPGEFKEQMIRVPEGHCWLVGDNLTWSRDSRVFGPVPLNLVKGKALALLTPFDQSKWFGEGSGLTDVEEGAFEKIYTK